MIPALCLIAPLAWQDAKPVPAGPQLEAGPWHVELDSPGGPLPFELYVKPDAAGQRHLHVVNGREYIALERWRIDGQLLRIDIPHYQSEITARLAEDGKSFVGEWTKVSGTGEPTRMELVGRAGSEPRFPLEDEVEVEAPGELTGRWRVEFSGSEHHAVGIFEAHEDGTATGTFLTSLGDYRYLAGDFRGGRLRLSCFDGAHAFLFDASMDAAGRLRGDFWSRDTWHETWMAARDPEVELPDPFGLSQWKEDVDLHSLTFLDAQGLEEVTLGDERFAGKVRLIQLFGTWCPNCHDEAPWLRTLGIRYRDRGVSIVGIAFEHGEDPKDNARQVRTFRERHRLEYPILLGGRSDKREATRAFRGLDRVIAYPTVLFVDARGEVRGIHTGFAGPATGEAHMRLRERYVDLIDTLLAEAEAEQEPR